MNVRATFIVAALLFVFAFVLGISWLAWIGVALLVAALIGALFQSHDWG